MTGRRGRSWLVAAVASSTLLGVACGGGGSTSSGASPSTGSPASNAIPTESAAGAGSVTATERDFAITLDQSGVVTGQTTFSITNEGPSTHEFVVFKTDLAPDALPVKGSTVDEDAAGLEAVDEKEDIASGATTTLTVSLDPGSYVVVCNLPGHYQAGMRAALTVS